MFASIGAFLPQGKQNAVGMKNPFIHSCLLLCPGCSQSTQETPEGGSASLPTFYPPPKDKQATVCFFLASAKFLMEEFAFLLKQTGVPVLCNSPLCQELPVSPGADRPFLPGTHRNWESSCLQLEGSGQQYLESPSRVSAEGWRGGQCVLKALFSLFQLLSDRGDF